MYLAWRGPAGSLTPLEGKKLDGSRVTNSHTPVVSMMPTWVYSNDVNFTDPPMTITSGGTYTGLRISAPDGVNCVTINTSDVVIFQDCIFEHSDGDGIYAPGGTVAGFAGSPKIEVYNSVFLGRHPTTFGSEIEHAILYASGSRLIVENCQIQRGRIYAYQHSNSASAVLRIRYNYGLNIDGREVDGNGVPTTNKQIQQFFQHNGTFGVAGPFEIAWNEIWNEHDDSAVEDCINFYRTGGTATNKLHVHHNLVNGAYPANPAVTNYSGGGILIADGSGDYGYSIAEYNVVLASGNYGVAIAAANNCEIRNNRVFRTGYLPDGVTSGVTGNGSGIYAYNPYGEPTFGSHAVTDNVVRFLDDPDGDNVNGQDIWIDSIGPNPEISNNVIYSGTVDQAFIDNEVILFRQGAQSAGVVIGVNIGGSDPPPPPPPPPIDNSVLFVKGSASLNTSENLIISRLESQSYVVDVTTDSLVTTETANGYDLVIMSKTVNSTTVGTKLRNSTAPVMFWEDNQQAGSVTGPTGNIWMATIDDSGLTNTAWHGTGTTVHVDASAPADLRANLSGTTSYYNTSNVITFAPKDSGGSVTALIPGAIQVAEFGSFSGSEQIAIYVVDSGVTLADGTLAPNRRGFFGLDDDTFQLLTANGLALFDAQVSWLTGNAVQPITGGTGSVSLVGTPSVAGAGTFDSTPSSSSHVLYVHDSTGTTAGDNAFITLFQNSGRTVTTYADNLSIPVDMSPYNVVFISESCLSTNVLAKWNLVAQGVINAENGSWDEMNLASGNTTLTATTTLTVVGGHPISSGYSGDTSILTTAAQMRIGATLAASAVTIAHQVGVPTNEVIFAYESGASLLNGDTAAGRRVALGYHGDTMTALAQPGIDILLSALSWAESNQSVSLGTGSVSLSGTPTISSSGTLDITTFLGSGSITIPAIQSVSSTGTLTATTYTGPGSVTFSGIPTISSSGTYSASASKSLLYVRPAAGASAGDLVFIPMFEGDGWTVTQIADNVAAPGDMSLYDAVFISGATSSASVAAKYKNVTVGVVVGNNGSWDDMDLALGSATIAANTQVAVYAGHPIAGAYSGITTIFTTAAQMRWANPVGVTQTNGTLVASRFDTIGEGMLWAYESGATMENSFVAPGRRVGAGLHPDTMTVLATAGEDLVRAAVNWVAGL